MAGMKAIRLSRSGRGVSAPVPVARRLSASVLSGLVRGPAGGYQLGHARQGEASLEPVDGVLQIPARIDAQNEAVVDEGVSDGEALTPTVRASEKEVAAIMESFP